MSKLAGWAWIVFLASGVMYLAGAILASPLLLLISVIGAATTLYLAIKACDQPADKEDNLCL